MKRNSIAAMVTIGALAIVAAMVPALMTATAVYAQVNQSNSLSNSEFGSSSALGHVTTAGNSSGGSASSSGNTNALTHQGACLQGANSIGGDARNLCLITTNNNSSK
ncbi:MAG: hypothetical protein M3044_00590 [Thermoproteota archaeon]|nr:hypothetical protein [Thermoproteota archaeon]